jgi:hypothetical protein
MARHAPPHQAKRLPNGAQPTACAVGADDSPLNILGGVQQLV